MAFEHFIRAQEHTYDQALAEIRNGRKTSHWMWFIFPQLAGLGFSEMAKAYALRNVEEAGQYLAHPVLGKRLVEIAQAMLAHREKTALSILGSPDDLKLRSSMTLFALARGADPVFRQVLDQFYDGKPDQKTLGRTGHAWTD
jgi:uncharacterized protein (DUF1810 family)